jgi:hypothetical protein
MDRVLKVKESLRPMLCAIACGLLALSGCDTIGQDLKGFTRGLVPVKPAEAARMMVNPHDADERREGTTLISNAPWGGVDIYLKVYRDMVLNEPDPIAKAAAIRALARWGEPEDAVRIMPHLAHENIQVRWEAAKGLQRIYNPAVVTELLRVLRDDQEQYNVRSAAATALAMYPEDRVFQGLVGALDARELAVNEAAERSLEILTGYTFEMDSQSWLAWYESVGSTEQAFAGQQQFLYPTYYRRDFWWEKVMFWTSRNWELPAPPAGLRPATQRDTYADEAPPLPET